MNNKENNSFFSRLLGTLIDIGLGESFLRAGTTILTVFLIGVVVWLIRLFFAQEPSSISVINLGPPEPTAIISGGAPSQPEVVESFGGVPRLAQVDTTIPSRPRQEIIKYTVEEGDTVFGIAENFGLNPETVLWGNYYILLDDPHALKAGQELNILPVNGTYHEWQQGEGLNGVAKYYGVTPEDIVNYPPNQLSLETVGDFEGGQRVPTLQINDILSIKRAVQGGAGIAMLPDYVINKDSGLVQLLPETEVPSFDTYFAYPDAMKNQAKLHVFRDFIIAKARSWSF